MQQNDFLSARSGACSSKCPHGTGVESLTGATLWGGSTLRRRQHCAAASRLEGGQGHDGDSVVGLVTVAECGEHDKAGWFSAPGGVDL